MPQATGIPALQRLRAWPSPSVPLPTPSVPLALPVTYPLSLEARASLTAAMAASLPPNCTQSALPFPP